MNTKLRLPLLLAAICCAGCGEDSKPTTPTAAATPTPAPTPSPTPTPFGVGIACGLPAMPECGRPEDPVGVWGCCRAEKEGEWASRIWDAIDVVRTEQPALFDGDRVLDREKYLASVAVVLERRYGVCAKPGAVNDEVGVKTTNEFSEQYDIYLSTGKVRYPGYKVTCRPARF